MSANSQKSATGLALLFGLLFQKITQGPLWITSYFKAFFFRPSLLFSLWLLALYHHGKLYLYRSGCKVGVPRAGIEPARLDQPPECKSGLFTNSSTGAQALSTGARGGYN